MMFWIDLGVEPARVPEALAELRREGAMRRAVYPKWIAAGKLTQAAAVQRLNSLADAYRVVEAVAAAVAPLLAAERERAVGSVEWAVGSGEVGQ